MPAWITWERTLVVFAGFWTAFVFAVNYIAPGREEITGAILEQLMRQNGQQLRWANCEKLAIEHEVDPEICLDIKLIELETDRQNMERQIN